MSSKGVFILILEQLFIDRSSIDRYTGVFLEEMCSDRCKNHGCRQKITEGTSSAMFDVRTIAKCWEFKRCTSTRFDVTRVTRVMQVTVLIKINTGVFLGKMCSDHRKNHGCGQKKPEGTSSAIFEIGTAAKYCELKRCADPVRSTEPTTKMKSLNVIWPFCFPIKTTEYSVESDWLYCLFPERT